MMMCSIPFNAKSACFGLLMVNSWLFCCCRTQLSASLLCCAFGVILTAQPLFLEEPQSHAYEFVFPATVWPFPALSSLSHLSLALPYTIIRLHLCRNPWNPWRSTGCRNELDSCFKGHREQSWVVQYGDEAVRLSGMPLGHLEVGKGACVRASAQLVCLLGPSA